MVEHEFGVWLGQLASQAKKLPKPELNTITPLSPTLLLPIYTAFPGVLRLPYEGKLRLISNLKLGSIK